MQWLIDIAIEAMEQYLADNPRFVDRGEQGIPDYTHADLTLDGNPHDLSFAHVIPAGAVAALFAWTFLDANVSSFLTMWKKENVGCGNCISIYTTTALIYDVQDLVCPIGPSRILTYHGGPIDFLEIYIAVKGWWL